MNKYMPRREYFSPLSSALVPSTGVAVGLETVSDEDSFLEVTAFLVEGETGPVDAI